MWPRVTSDNSPYWHANTFYAVFVNCIGGKSWAARVVLTTRSKCWRNPFLIKPYGFDKNFSHAFAPSLLRALGSKSLNSLWKFGWLRSTRITIWVLVGILFNSWATRWRSCLETLWRTTEPPTDLFTISPTWGASGLFKLALRYRTSERDVARTPVLVVKAKSLLARNLFLVGSTDIGSYAEMLVRPLARRRARTALPPRVAMRARKPCFFARLRTFGWKVRFDINFSLKLLGISPAGLHLLGHNYHSYDEGVRLRPPVDKGQTRDLRQIKIWWDFKDLWITTCAF